MAQKIKSGARFHHNLRGRVQTAPKELEVLGYELCAATVLNGNVVNTIRMEYKHAGVAGYGFWAEHTGMVELQLESQRLQGYLHESFADPFLHQIERSDGRFGSDIVVLTSIRWKGCILCLFRQQDWQTKSGRKHSWHRNWAGDGVGLPLTRQSPHCSADLKSPRPLHRVTSSRYV